MSTATPKHTQGLFFPMISIDPENFTTRPARQKIGPFIAAVIILGFATAALVYLLAMRDIGWQPPAVGKNPSGFPVLFGGSSTISKNHILYVSPNTQTYFSSIGGRYEILLSPWRTYFSNRHIKLKEISDIRELSSLNNGTLILPSALALDENERLAIKSFRAQGGAILATWASGSRNGQGDWVGWEFLGSLGSKVIGEISPESTAKHLILNGESPVSFTHPAGLRIWLGKPAERYLRLLPIDQNAQIAARLMDWARIPETERINEGALIFSESSPQIGRTAVLGFAETSWDASPNAIFTLLDDTLSWLARNPRMIRAAWPEGRRSAQIVEMDTEEGFPNALHFASLMNAANYRGSFYLLSSQAKQYPEVTHALARDFEIGLHGDIHTGFKDQSTSGQQARMENMQAELASVFTKQPKITGFRAPNESYDETTEKLLVKNGFRYHVVDPSRSDARLPLIVRQEGVLIEESFVVLPRTQRDDINLAKEGLSSEQLSEALEQDLALGIDMGALGLLSIHSQNFGNESPLAVAMPKFLQKMAKRPDVWAASGEQVADWWRNRERFKVKFNHFNNRVDFDISVIGETALKGGTLIVMLPARDVTPVIQEIKIGMPKPKLIKLDPFRAAIVFDELAPGDYTYQITFKIN